MDRNAVETISEHPGNGDGGVDSNHGVCGPAKDGRPEDSQEEQANGDLCKRDQCFVCEDKGKEMLKESVFVNETTTVGAPCMPW